MLIDRREPSSIVEVYRFGDDGSVEIRTHFDVPDAADPVAGALFEPYLPGHE